MNYPQQPYYDPAQQPYYPPPQQQYYPPQAYYPPPQAYPAVPQAYPSAPAPGLSFDPDTDWDTLLKMIARQNAPPAKTDAKAPAKGRTRAMQIISAIVFYAVAVGLIGGAILFAFSKNPQKSYLGYRSYSVLTPSMTPAPDGSSPPGGFGAGALIIVRMCKPEQVRVGDIITFNPSVRETDNTSYLTHRVVRILPELGGSQGIFFVTRGDANDSDDPPISANMLIGKKIFSLPGVGDFMQKVRENLALTIAIIVCFFMSILLFRWYFSGAKLKRRNKKKEPT